MAERTSIRALLPRFRPGDLDDRDPDYMREILPVLWLAVTAWFRPSITGLENLPREGAALVIGNHTGGTSSPEVLISQLAFSTYLGVERSHYQLAHRMVLNSPLGPIVRRFGTVEADPANARKALDEGAIVTVFPGGDYEVFRPTWESGRIDMGGRKGFLKIALDMDVPIVPMVSLGGQETALFLTRGEGIARALRLDKALRLKTFPVMLALPFGLMVGGLPHLPLPAKIQLRLLPAIHLRAEFGESPDLDEVYDQIISRMQSAMDEMQRTRRLPVIG